MAALFIRRFIENRTHLPRKLSIKDVQLQLQRILQEASGQRKVRIIEKSSEYCRFSSVYDFECRIRQA